LSRNKKRTASGLENKKPDVADPVATTAGGLTFSTPTEYVEIPSRGKYYPEGHPLHDEDTVEIKYMTAKEEDILTSQSLLKKGLALERLLASILVDKTIDPSSLLVGDRSAILIAARKTGYGSEYETRLNCPSCASNVTYSFDLDSVGAPSDQKLPEVDENSTFTIKLPALKVGVQVKMLAGSDETRLLKLQESKRKRNLPETLLSDQLSSIIVSVEGHTDRAVINNLIENIPASDSKHLRRTYEKCIPAIDMTHPYNCSNCGYAADLEVPLTTDFFWPK